MFPLVLTGALLFGMQPLQAATTKRFVLTPAEAKTFEAWTKFLAEGTPTWSTTHAPAFTPAIESTIWQVLKTDTEAQSIANPMIDYLEWRRSLDPTRFTDNHPNLSPALAQLLSSPSLPANPPPPTDTPVSETPMLTPTLPPKPKPKPKPKPTPTPTLAQTVSPPTVPEPSSLLLAAAMTGWGIWWRHQLAKQNSR